MKITSKPFGVTDGKEVRLYRLENASGAYAEVMNYGCTVRSIVVPDKDGKLTDVVLGYDTLEEYTGQNGCLGACIGRHANRLGNAAFRLNGVTYRLAANSAGNNLHGGVRGFDKRVWDAEETAEALVFSRLSPDGEEGFPGNLKVTISFSFDDQNELTILYRAIGNRDTVVNMTNHTYFHLDGQGAGNVYDTRLYINADSFTENDANCLPTGKILSVKDTPFDFTVEKPIGRDIEKDDVNLKNGKGYDHNFVLRGSGEKVAAAAYSGKSGIELTVCTTQPGVQLYTANFLTDRPGKNGTRYEERHGFCLETQHFPNAMACVNFPSPILRAGETYNQKTVFAFGVR